MNKPLAITLAAAGSVLLLALGIGAGFFLSHVSFAASDIPRLFLHQSMARR